jgi:hypothetical protein
MVKCNDCPTTVSNSGLLTTPELIPASNEKELPVLPHTHKDNWKRPTSVSVFLQYRRPIRWTHHIFGEHRENVVPRCHLKEILLVSTLDQGLLHVTDLVPDRIKTEYIE